MLSFSVWMAALPESHRVADRTDTALAGVVDPIESHGCRPGLWLAQESDLLDDIGILLDGKDVRTPEQGEGSRCRLPG